MKLSNILSLASIDLIMLELECHYILIINTFYTLGKDSFRKRPLFWPKWTLMDNESESQVKTW